MNTIQIPETIKLVNPITDEPMMVVGSDGQPTEKQLTSRFVEDFLLPLLLDAKWGRELSYVFAAIDLRGLFKGRKPGEFVRLTEDIWKKLLEVVSEPTNPYTMMMAGQVRPFFTAVKTPLDDAAYDKLIALPPVVVVKIAEPERAPEPIVAISADAD